MSSNFREIVDKYNNLSADNKDLLLNELRTKWRGTELTKDVDIISDANLLYLMVVDALEALPRKGDKNRPALALSYLKASESKFLNSLGINKSLVKEEVYAPAVSYVILGSCLAQKESVSKSFWRAIYLIVNAIFVKEERYVGPWFDTAEFMYGNFLSEDYLVNTIPGLMFNSRGVRHDMLCATNGTADPDFLYTEHGLTYTAEFKLPTRTVEALARYGYNNPKYIYNADILFTYKASESRFYKIDYTVPDIIKNTAYTIEALNIKGDITRLTKAS